MTTSTSGNPLGPFVEPLTARPPPSTSINGRTVSLEPRHPSHFDDLYDVIGGQENIRLWDYVPNGPFIEREEFREALSDRLRIPNSNVYTIMNNTSQKPIGTIALTDINLDNRTIQVGWIIFSKQMQRTIAATEVMYLLASLVFDTLGYRRFEWKCDNLNKPSNNAAQRFGFKFEGVFRQHMIIKGRNRDTAWFAMLDGEWPAIKRGYERWLDDGNFDEEGRQRRSLAVLRESP
jgi:RimJ/RimL family protein N-acetyltransferase